MDEFKTMPTEKLLDLLSEYTENYGHMIKDGTAYHDFESVKLILMNLQDEIKLRHSATRSTTPPNIDIDVKTERAI